MARSDKTVVFTNKKIIINLERVGEALTKTELGQFHKVIDKLIAHDRGEGN